jgi:hypothetical protein
MAIDIVKVMAPQCLSWYTTWALALALADTENVTARGRSASIMLSRKGATRTEVLAQ